MNKLKIILDSMAVVIVASCSSASPVGPAKTPSAISIESAGQPAPSSSERESPTALVSRNEKASPTVGISIVPSPLRETPPPKTPAPLSRKTTRSRLGAGLRMSPQLGHRRRIRSVALSAGRALLVSGSDDRTARIWDANSGRLIHILPTTGDVRQTAFLPNGYQVVAADNAGRMRIWNTASGEVVKEIDTHYGEIIS